MFFVLQMDGTDTHLLVFESPKVSNKNKSPQRFFCFSKVYFHSNTNKLYDSILTIFCIQRTKPKGLVDLGCAYLYPLHDSFFDKPFCLQLVERALPCLATVTYLCAPSQEEFQVIRFSSLMIVRLRLIFNISSLSFQLYSILKLIVV